MQSGGVGTRKEASQAERGNKKRRASESHNLESEQRTSGVRRRAGKERQAPEGKRKKQTKEAKR